ncbi:hypothetical protein B7494_g4385 [Chlorociboria aeruginascens]|nr:hypothetical protein B7494_g4385 [Chlorociboria aeruginascens]
MSIEQRHTISCGGQATAALQNLWNLHGPTTSRPAFKLPPISSSRLETPRSSDEEEKTFLYLAYGSNLSAKTFKGNRGIKPLAAINVHVPSLTLTFDLPGIPYVEPCFANSRYSTPSSESTWDKGLVGVVYEVTPADYRTIIATEGGGASYQDILVPCYPLSNSPTVSPTPSGTPFEAHTLLSPPYLNGRLENYAQPSVRYLKLLTDGAEENSLPAEYKNYLYSLQAFTITTQRIGQVLFLALWAPFMVAILGLTKLFADEEGKVPRWLRRFGDGERTIGGDDEEAAVRWDEKRGFDGELSQNLDEDEMRR